MLFAQENGRTIPKEDKIFAINGRAKAMIAEQGKENVVNATIGALLDDEGNLTVLSSVIDAIGTLAPVDFAEYAPIGGTPEFKKAVEKALFGSKRPEGEVRVCATPGGTGAIRSVIGNYSAPGDAVLTHDWYWANYKNIAGELGRGFETFEFFNEEGSFNAESFAEKLNALAAKQESLVVIINTPAHNPTGYSLSDDDWKKAIAALNEAAKDCRIALFIDVAYIDYSGDEEEARSFMPLLADLSDNVLPLFGYSASKTLTLYGMRCGAIVCLAKDADVAEEFRQVSEFSARATWSNCARAAQAAMGKIYEDPELESKVGAERAGIRDMLLERGRAFEAALKEEGVESVPFDAGFFASIASDDPDALSAELEKEGIFTVPLAKGVRVSVASISKEKCVKTAKAIARIVKG